MNRQTHVKINRKVTLFIEHSRTKKSKYCCHPPFHPPIFCRHSLKLLSPTLPKLMNWMLLSPPPLSSDPDTPQNLERAQEGVEDNLHFLLDCSFLCEHFSSLWSKLQQKISKLDLVDGPGIVPFLNNLDRANKALFLLGGLLLPFQKQISIMIRKFVSIAVFKIYQLRLAKLREMEAPWLTR